MKKTIIKLGVIFVVMNLVGIAVALFLATGLGSDSIGLLCDGLRTALGISFGNASLLYNLVVIILAFIFARKNLGAGTIFYALVSGYFMDFYGLVFEPFHLVNQAILVRAISFGIGQCCLSLGLALLIQMELGMNALDALIYKFQDKTGIQYRIIRTCVDCSYVVIGTLLGGTFGIGTICSVLLTGTMVSKIIQLIENHRKMEEKIVYESKTI